MYLNEEGGLSGSHSSKVLHEYSESQTVPLVINKFLLVELDVLFSSGPFCFYFFIFYLLFSIRLGLFLQLVYSHFTSSVLHKDLV